jgi:hypothetical protein
MGGEREIGVPLDRQQKGEGWRPFLDLCPKAKGRWNGSNYASPVSLAYGSFPTLRHDSPIDGIFDQWTSTEAPLS